MDYDLMASEYDRRYALHDYAGVRSTLLEDVSRGMRVLELGCGTGRWLEHFVAAGCDVAGIDPSERMLECARQRVVGDLRRGEAEALPWSDESFDVVALVNSLHHFTVPEKAMREAFRVSKKGGVLVSIGLDPHEVGDRWYVYEFFPETVQLDLERFPSREQRTAWLAGAGFWNISIHVAERIRSARSLDEARRDGVLEPSFTSQLGALTPEQYAAGMERLTAADRSRPLTLKADLELYVTRGWKPGN